jgi:hypothetical protein
VHTNQKERKKIRIAFARLSRIIFGMNEKEKEESTSIVGRKKGLSVHVYFFCVTFESGTI